MDEEAAQTGGTAGGAPGEPAATPRRRPDLEVLKSRRLKRLRLRRRIVGAFAIAALLFLAAVGVDWRLRVHYQDLYKEQPWYEIQTTFLEIDRGNVLQVNKEDVLKGLDEKYLDREGYVIGRVTEVKEGPKGLAQVVLDVPTFVEEINLFEDDAFVEIPAPAAAAFRRGEWVFGKGTVEHFSMYRLRLTDGTLRPLGLLESHYIALVVPPTRLDREPIGLRSLME